MSNPTSNFGWQMPTNSDLVTDLPADFEVFGQGVDTTLADLKGGTTGQILSKATNADMDFVWTNLNPGDITGVTATSPLTGGGTSGDVTIGIQAASTSQSGAVQLTDSTSSTSTSTAATPNSVKSAYDLANAAVPNTRTISTTSPLSGGGALSGNLTLSVGAGSTSTAGVLQLTDSTSSTSTTTAATPNSVKSAYDPAFTNNFYAGKNKIINGDFGIWQRGAGAFTSSSYSADRWTFYGQGAGTSHSATQQTFTTGTAPVAGYEGTYFYRDVIVSGSDAATQMILIQKIEDVRTFANQTVTVSFWAKASSGTPKIGIEFYQDFGSGGSGAVSGTGQSVTLSTSWARYSATLNVPSVSGKTIGTGSALFLNLWLSSGSSSASRSGSIGLQSNTFDIWGVQVEAGSTATPFQTATGTKQGELAACQRYYWRYGGDQTYQILGYGIGYSTTDCYIGIKYPVTMRTVPTSIDFSTLCVQRDPSQSLYAVTALANLNGNGSGRDVFGLKVTIGSTSLAAGTPYTLLCNGSTSAYLGFSAEL